MIFESYQAGAGGYFLFCYKHIWTSFAGYGSASERVREQGFDYEGCGGGDGMQEAGTDFCGELSWESMMN